MQEFTRDFIRELKDGGAADTVLFHIPEHELSDDAPRPITVADVLKALDAVAYATRQKMDQMGPENLGGKQSIYRHFIAALNLLMPMTALADSNVVVLDPPFPEDEKADKIEAKLLIGDPGQTVLSKNEFALMHADVLYRLIDNTKVLDRFRDIMMEHPFYITAHHFRDNIVDMLISNSKREKR